MIWARLGAAWRRPNEANLPELLALRAVARCGRLPDSTAAQRLVDSLPGRCPPPWCTGTCT